MPTLDIRLLYNGNLYSANRRRHEQVKIGMVNEVKISIWKVRFWRRATSALLIEQAY